MKKLLTTLTMSLLAVMLCFTIAACNSNIKGVYVFDEIKASDSGEAGQAAVDFYKDIFEGMQYKFESNGKVLASIDSGETWDESENTYKVEGKDVKISDKDGNVDDSSTMKIDGNKLVITFEYDGITLTVTMKKA